MKESGNYTAIFFEAIHTKHCGIYWSSARQFSWTYSSSQISSASRSGSEPAVNIVEATASNIPQQEICSSMVGVFQSTQVIKEIKDREKKKKSVHSGGGCCEHAAWVVADARAGRADSTCAHSCAR